jgi:integrase
VGKDLLPTYRESTREFYRSTAQRWIQPYFADWRIADIQPADLQRFINLFGEKYSRSVLKHIRATLNCLFEAAVTWRYVKENPCAGLRLPQGKSVQRATVLKPEQLAQVIGHLSEPYRTMAVIATMTGLRESELFGLQWGDFDLDRGVLTVQRRLYRGKLGECKTAKSQRELPLHSVVIEAVRGLDKHGPSSSSNRTATAKRP